jgi:hypothetical protein
MGRISVLTHEFCRRKIDGDGSYLYTSFRYVNGTVEKMDNKGLRSMVALDLLCLWYILLFAELYVGTQRPTIDLKPLLSIFSPVSFT